MKQTSVWLDEKQFIRIKKKLISRGMTFTGWVRDKMKEDLKRKSNICPKCGHMDL